MVVYEPSFEILRRGGTRLPVSFLIIFVGALAPWGAMTSADPEMSTDEYRIGMDPALEGVWIDWKCNEDHFLSGSVAKQEVCGRAYDIFEST